jgi:hypothetical protein
MPASSSTMPAASQTSSSSSTIPAVSQSSSSSSTMPAASQTSRTTNSNSINSINPMTTTSMDNNKKGSSTNIYQKNFDGTSNVYAPYIYYNMEEAFTPLNLYDDKYSEY